MRLPTAASSAATPKKQEPSTQVASKRLQGVWLQRQKDMDHQPKNGLVGSYERRECIPVGGCQALDFHGCLETSLL